MGQETLPPTDGSTPSKTSFGGAVISVVIILVLVSACVAWEVAKAAWFIDWLKS